MAMKYANIVITRGIVKKKKKGFISLIDKWDVEKKIQDHFNITDYMSQKLTLEVLEMGQKRG
jgi:hypothetical protein